MVEDVLKLASKTSFSRRTRWLLLVGIACCLVGTSAYAEMTRFYELEGFGPFLKGNPESTALTEDGALILPPESEEWYANPVESFSAVTTIGSRVVVARNGDGAVLSIDSAGKAEEIFKVEETFVTSLLQYQGALIAAAGPAAKLYLVRDGDAPALFYQPDAAYIWDMAVAGDKIYLVTGEPATVVEVDAGGNGKILFSPEHEHLKTIVHDDDLGLFVGAGDNGIVYHSAAVDKPVFRALYDTRFPEVTAIVVHGQHAYVAGVEGAATLANVGKSANARAPGKGRGDANRSSVRSTLVKVGLDGSAEVLAGSSDEAIFAMRMNAQGELLVATGASGRDDPRGRLYSVRPKDRRVALVYQSPSRRITHLVDMQEAQLVAVAASGGRITHLTGELAKKGEFFSEPLDAEINSRFGVMQVFGTAGENQKATAAIRTGQTAKPDDTWSAWSSEIGISGGGKTDVPSGRYAQIRVALSADGSDSPSVYRVRIAYLRQNLSPYIREVRALDKGIALIPMLREAPKATTITLSDQSDSGKSGGKSNNSSSMRTKVRRIEEPGALTVRWSAEDTNGDKLQYDLMVRSTGDTSWRTVEDELRYPFYTIHSSQLPDGHYQFRVRADDSLSNPPADALEDFRESRSVLIDNTEPVVSPIVVDVTDGAVQVRATVNDNVGPLTLATYSLDGGDFVMASTQDGILDGPDEVLELSFDKLDKGQHTLTIRVIDGAQNAGVGQTVFEVP